MLYYVLLRSVCVIMPPQRAKAERLNKREIRRASSQYISILE